MLHFNKKTKDNIKTRLQSLGTDFGAAFSVSLIALPLAIGLAMASNVPPMAGIIASVIGGIVVALLGGSHVTITGPGNGLVVAILTSVTLLGNGDLVAGYHYTLAAVVVSGVLIMLLGFFKLGVIGDVFPSSAIRGMLAAIGVIILIKQYYVMLGVPVPEGASNFELLIKMPEAIIGVFQQEGFPWVAVIGLLSLLIMVGHPLIKIKWVHVVPTPMLVVIFAIGVSYYFEWFSNEPYPIEKEYLLSIPKKITDSIVFPDFGKVFTYPFFVSVAGILLICSVESVLSIKAIDKLDPLKRRSNTNKDLKALGLGSVLSGLIGGMPVVTVIARSSVNVNHGAKTRASNFFHGSLLLAAILLLREVLTRIPLAAMAGILVYTGYKLTSPDVIRNIRRTGREQLAVFCITLVSVLLVGLIEGVGIGICSALLIQWGQVKDKHLVLRPPWLPNSVMYQEEDGKFYVTVRGMSYFLNYLQLKKQLDAIPRSQHVILDFSLCQFVGHTVMEHVAAYANDYQQGGGEFEIIGLDMHQPYATHPFAARKLYLGNKEQEATPGVSTKRQAELEEYAHEIGWSFSPEPTYNVTSLQGFPLFKAKTASHIQNTLSGENNGVKFKLFDIEYYEGAFIAKEVYRTSVLRITLPEKIPEFTLDKEGVLHKVAELAGFYDIDLEQHKDFSRRFRLNGQDKEAIRRFFNKDLVLFLESNPYYHIQSSRNEMLVFKKNRKASLTEIKALVNFGKRLAAQVVKATPL